MLSTAAKPDTASHTARCVPTISLGRPVLPPDVGALNDAAIAGGSASADVDEGGERPAATVARPGASCGSTPTTSEGLASSMIALRSAVGRREEMGWGVAPSFQAATVAS